MLRLHYVPDPPNYPAQMGWHRGNAGIVISQKKLGVEVIHVQWLEDADARPVCKYDQILRAERPGILFLPVDRQNRIGLQKMFRPQVIDAEKYLREFPQIDLRNLGRHSYEVPRGFGKPNESAEQAAIREAESETGSRLIGYHPLPPICDNTAFSPHLTNVGWGEIDLTQPSGVPEDPLEIILSKVHFFSLEELPKLQAEGLLYCGYTLTVIGSFLLNGR